MFKSHAKSIAVLFNRSTLMAETNPFPNSNEGDNSLWLIALNKTRAAQESGLEILFLS
jgi:hypothetical protein